MKRTIMKTPFLLASMLSMAVVIASCGNDPKKPGYELFKDMKHSVPYDTFAPNPVTRDGKTLQAPVAGTLPRGVMPYHYTTSPEDAAKAKETVNPLPVTPENVARGKKLYGVFCAVCHGENGDGNGPVSAKYIKPPSFGDAFMGNMSQGWIFHVITHGNAKIMPSYGSQIDPEDRWKITQYIAQELQKKKP